MARIRGRSEQADPDGRIDPWAGFAPGEDSEIHDPVQARSDAYRGMFWVQIQIGTWWVVLIQALGLALIVGASVVGLWQVAIVLFLAVVVFTLAADQATPGWAEDHNARVRRAQELERRLATRDRADDLAWRVRGPDAR